MIVVAAAAAVLLGSHSPNQLQLSYTAADLSTGGDFGSTQKEKFKNWTQGLHTLSRAASFSIRLNYEGGSSLEQDGIYLEDANAVAIVTALKDGTDALITEGTKRLRICNEANDFIIFQTDDGTEPDVCSTLKSTYVDAEAPLQSLMMYAAPGSSAGTVGAKQGFSSNTSSVLNTPSFDTFNVTLTVISYDFEPPEYDWFLSASHTYEDNIESQVEGCAKFTRLFESLKSYGTMTAFLFSVDGMEYSCTNTDSGRKLQNGFYNALNNADLSLAALNLNFICNSVSGSEEVWTMNVERWSFPTNNRGDLYMNGPIAIYRDTAIVNIDGTSQPLERMYQCEYDHQNITQELLFSPCNGRGVGGSKGESPCVGDGKTKRLSVEFYGNNTIEYVSKQQLVWNLGIQGTISAACNAFTEHRAIIPEEVGYISHEIQKLHYGVGQTTNPPITCTDQVNASIIASAIANISGNTDLVTTECDHHVWQICPSLSASQFLKQYFAVVTPFGNTPPTFGCTDPDLTDGMCSTENKFNESYVFAPCGIRENLTYIGGIGRVLAAPLSYTPDFSNFCLKDMTEAYMEVDYGALEEETDTTPATTPPTNSTTPTTIPCTTPKTTTSVTTTETTNATTSTVAPTCPSDGSGLSTADTVGIIVGVSSGFAILAALGTYFMIKGCGDCQNCCGRKGYERVPRYNIPIGDV